MRILLLASLLLPVSALADTGWTFYAVACTPALGIARIDTFGVADADDFVYPLAPQIVGDPKADAAARFKSHEENLRRLAAVGIYAYGPDNGALYQANPVECVLPHYTLIVRIKPVRGKFLQGGPVTYGSKPRIEIEKDGQVVFSEVLEETESLFFENHTGLTILMTRCVDERYRAPNTYHRDCTEGVPIGTR